MSLGKRKRSSKAHAADEDDELMREAFRKAFESRFVPLEKDERVEEATDDESSSQSDSGSWDGFVSEEDIEDAPVIIAKIPTPSEEAKDKSSYKTFMVCNGLQLSLS
jgi:hypothetical protein